MKYENEIHWPKMIALGITFGGLVYVLTFAYQVWSVLVN